MGAVNASVQISGGGKAQTPSRRANPPSHCNTAAIYNCAMYIIAIGWLYVSVLMALTETSIVAGILSLVVYGLLPVALLLWLFARPVRRKNSAGVADGRPEE